MLQTIMMSLDKEYSARLTVGDDGLQTLEVIGHQILGVGEQLTLTRVAIMNLAVLLGHCIANHDPKMVVDALNSHERGTIEAVARLADQQSELPF